MSDSNDATTPPTVARSVRNLTKIGATVAVGALTLAAISFDSSPAKAPIDVGVAPSKSLSVLTWNVWFGARQQKKRYDFLVSKVVEFSPDVACFQEVTSPFLKALNTNEDIRESYHVTDNPIDSYGVVSLVRKDVAAELDFEEVDLDSRMGRSLLVARIPVSVPARTGGGAETRYVQVGNVHLESLGNESRRRRQLEASRDRLARDRQSRPTAALLVGDFNFDSSQTWGDWDRSRPQHSKHTLENNVLAEVMPQWVDAWPYLKGDDPGLTFDGATNGCVKNRMERMRYDRMMVMINSEGGEDVRLEPRSIEMVGTEAIDSTGLKASDHYGIFMKVDIVS